MILLVVYRSLLLPIAVLLMSVFALCAAMLLVFGMAKAGLIPPRILCNKLQSLTG